jgi:regulator of replication initiation timing
MTEQERVAELISEVKKQTGIDVIVKSRILECVSYRQCLMVYVMNDTALTLQGAGDCFKRDHATVLHAVKTHQDHIIDEGNKGDVYRTCWANVNTIVEGKPLSIDEDDYHEDFKMNVSLRKKVRKLNQTIVNYTNANSALMLENAILRKEIKALRHKIDLDPTTKFDKGPLVKQVEHNWEFTREKPQIDNFTVGGIRFF